MMDQIETAAFLLGASWIFYKFYKTKNPRHLFLAIFCLLAVVSRWPLYFPIQIFFGLISIVAAGFCFFENYSKGKKASPMAYMYIVLFVGFGLMFLAEGASKMVFAK